jgi:squalene cyclase
MKRLLRSVLIFVLVATAVVAFAQPSHAQAKADLKAAVKWLRGLQNSDGGFTDGFKPDSNVSATADAVYAIAIANEDVTTFNKGGKTPLDYLQDQIKAGKVTKTGEWAKILRAITLASADAGQAFGGVDVVQETVNALNKSSDGKDIFGEGLAVIALAETDQVPQPAIENLIKTQNPDGGWGYAAGQPSDTNSTAVVIEAMIAVGKYRLVGSGLNYLKSQQNADGGWAFQKTNNADSDCNSTALGLEVLEMAGETPSDWNSPDVLLAKFQQKDGSFTYQLKQPAANFLATVAAIPVISNDALLSLNPTPAATQAK